MALKRHQYPRSKPPVKAEGGAARASEASTSKRAAARGALPSDGVPGRASPAARGSVHEDARDDVRDDVPDDVRDDGDGTAPTLASARDIGSPAVERSAEVSPLSRESLSRSSALAPAPADVMFRLLDYSSVSEVRCFLTLLHAISAEADPYHFDKTPEHIDRALIKARREENPSNTFAGLALHRGTMVAVHVLRRFEEGALVGAQVSGLWVSPAYRRLGIARRLKAMGEAWARSIGAHFLNTNVLSQNAPMLALNRALGFENYRINLRKRL